MYRILGTDQREYGPVTGEVVRQWIAQGRVHAQTQAQAEGDTAWRPLAEFPEFTDALATGRPPPVPVSTGRPAAGQQSGMAITSLVLGILSLFTCLITGIPAIITGHIAHSRARRQPGQFGGAGFAVAGLVMGYLSIAATFLMLPALLLPALAKAKARAQAINCVNNMKQIGLAAHLYANANKEVFPPDFLSMSSELGSPKILTCPADNSRVATRSWAECTPANISYEYLLPGAKVDGAARQELFRCPIHGSVCYGDGSVMMGAQGRKRPPPPF